jgi:hypothetical protein
MVRTGKAGRLPLLRLPDDSEQEVLGLDLARSRACRLNSREAEDHPGARRERDCPARARPLFALQLIGEDLSADAECFQGASSRGFAQGVQAQYQMFGPDVVIVARPRFGLGLLQQASRQRRQLWRGSAKESLGLSKVLALSRAPW